MIDKDSSLSSFLRGLPANFWTDADFTASTIKIQKHSLIEIVRQTIKMLMCSCHKLIIHTLLKIAQHDISKARPSSPHCRVEKKMMK